MNIITHEGNVNYTAFATDFAKREVLRKYIDVVNDQMGYLDWLDFTSRAVVTGDVKYENLTDGSLLDAVTVKASVSAGAADTDVTVIAKKEGVKPIVGEVIVFPDFKNALVYSVSPNGTDAADSDVVLRPIGSGSNVPALTANQLLFLSHDAQGEGGGLVGSMRRPTPVKRSNNIHVSSTSIDITDLAGATVLEIPFGGSNYKFDKSEWELMLKHRLSNANKFLTSVKGVTTDSDGRKVYTTDGLRPQIKTNGFNLSSATAGEWNLITDQKALSIAMDSARCGGADYMLLAGQSLDLAMDVDSLTNSAFSGGGISYAAYNGNERIHLAMGAKSFTMGGRTIHKSRFMPAEHNSGLGNTGYGQGRKEGYLLPTDKTKTLGSKGGTVDRIRTRYMVFGGTKDLRYLTTYDGALSKEKQGHRRVSEMAMSSNEGLETTGIEQFGMITI